MGKTHKEFVDLIVDYVRSDFPDPLAKSKKYFYEYEKAVINDGMKIRAIADYRGEDMEDNINIIGEAKTSRYSLREFSSQDQLREYLKSGKGKKNFHLIYAMPHIDLPYSKQTILTESKKASLSGFILHLLTDTNYVETIKI